MAKDKIPTTRKAGAARPPASRKPGSQASKSSAAKSSAAKSSAAKAGGRTPPKRPSTSIVNQRRTPWALIILVVVVILFAAAIIGYAVTKKSTSSATGAQIIPSTPTGTTTVQQKPKRVANTTGIKGVIAYDTEGWPGNGASHPGALAHTHVTGPVTYAVTPPVGGPHNATWMNAGVYTKPIPTERAVHNLEHGAVWITYDPDLAASKVAALKAFVGKQSLIAEQGTNISGQSNRYMDLSPWTSNALPTPIVLSSWGYQLQVTSPTDPRLQQFVDKFRYSKTYSPEYGSPVDGIPVQTGGRAAAFGSNKANPAGSQ